MKLEVLMIKCIFRRKRFGFLQDDSSDKQLRIILLFHFTDQLGVLSLSFRLKERVVKPKELTHSV